MKAMLTKRLLFNNLAAQSNILFPNKVSILQINAGCCASIAICRMELCLANVEDKNRLGDPVVHCFNAIAAPCASNKF